MNVNKHNDVFFVDGERRQKNAMKENYLNMLANAGKHVGWLF